LRFFLSRDFKKIVRVTDLPYCYCFCDWVCARYEMMYNGEREEIKIRRGGREMGFGGWMCCWSCPKDM